MNTKKHLKYTMGMLSVISLTVAVSCGNGGNNPNNSSQASSAQQETTSAARSTSQTPPPPPASAEPARSIPDFTFYILESGIRFNREDLAKNGNIVFMLFDPSCGHCQDEARDLSQHYDRIKDTNIYFVSMNDPALMSTFLSTHGKTLVGKDNITVLYDRNADFINRFHIPTQYPANYVYGSDGLLKQYWVGSKNIEEVVEAFIQ